MSTNNDVDYINVNSNSLTNFERYAVTSFRGHYKSNTF